MGIRLAKNTAPVLPGGRSMEEVLATLGTPGPPPVTGPVPTAVPPVELGGSTAGLSPLGILLARRRALQTAAPESAVRQTPTGIDIAPPQQMSRLRAALGTGLQGVAMVGDSGNPWQALGAFGTGAVAGAISPHLAAGFNRYQEQQRNLGDIGQQIGVETGVGRINDLLAQAEYTRARPEIEYTRIAQQQQEAADRIAAQDHATGQRATAASQASADRKAAIQQRRDAAGNKPRPTRVVDGVLWEQTDAGDWVRSRGGPTATTSDRTAAKEGRTAASESRQAQALYNKAHDYWSQAEQKRAEAGKLGGSVVEKARNKAAIDRLIREAEGLENKTRDLQKQGDILDAKSKSDVQTSGGPGKLTEAQVRAAATKAHLDPDEAVRRARAKGRL